MSLMFIQKCPRRSGVISSTCVKVVGVRLGYPDRVYRVGFKT